MKDKLLCLLIDLPTESGFKWTVLIMNKCECRLSKEIDFGTFIVFDIHKRLAKRFTV